MFEFATEKAEESRRLVRVPGRAFADLLVRNGKRFLCRAESGGNESDTRFPRNGLRGVLGVLGGNPGPAPLEARTGILGR